MYNHIMADDSVLEEAMDNLREAGQRIRATQHLLRSQGITGSENYRELTMGLSSALATTEAVEAVVYAMGYTWASHVYLFDQLSERLNPSGYT
jgi:hypothetical protein